MVNKNAGKIKIAFIASVLILLGLGFSGCYHSYNEVEVLKANWNIDMPQPLKIINVASNRGGLGGDGTAYHIFEYSDESVTGLKELNLWGSAGTIISNGISNSIKNLEKSDEVPAVSKELLKKYPPVVNDSCLYYYKDKGAFNYLIMVLDVTKKRVYIFESYT